MGWRYRVRSNRILAKIKDEELVVEVVRDKHKQGVYNNLPKCDQARSRRRAAENAIPYVEDVIPRKAASSNFTQKAPSWERRLQCRRQMKIASIPVGDAR